MDDATGLETLHHSEVSKQGDGERLSDIQKQLTTIHSVISKQESLARRNAYLTAVLALGGWAFACIQLYLSKKQRTWELLLDALTWFEGGTLRRSIAIAIVESQWSQYRDFRPRWLSILVSLCIHLLTTTKNRDAGDDVVNFYRAMNILIIHRRAVTALEREMLLKSLQEYDGRGTRGLMGISSESMNEWITVLAADA